MVVVDDLRPLHRQALLDATELVGRVTAADLGRDTPCAGWDLATLLAHMVGQHIGFTTAVREGDAPREAYEPVPFDAASWADSVELLQQAFAAADLAAEVHEIELHPTRPLPVAVLVGAQLLDTAVHTWDVARSLGLDYEPSPAIADAVLAIATPIPDGPGREAPGAAFAHAVTGEFMTPWSRALAVLGRVPSAPGSVSAQTTTEVVCADTERAATSPGDVTR